MIWINQLRGTKSNSITRAHICRFAQCTNSDSNMSARGEENFSQEGSHKEDWKENEGGLTNERKNEPPSISPQTASISR